MKAKAEAEAKEMQAKGLKRGEDFVDCESVPSSATYLTQVMPAYKMQLPLLVPTSVPCARLGSRSSRSSPPLARRSLRAWPEHRSGFGLVYLTCCRVLLPGPRWMRAKKFVVQGAFSSHAGGLAFFIFCIEPMCGNTCMKVPLPALLRYYHS